MFHKSIFLDRTVDVIWIFPACCIHKFQKTVRNCFEDKGRVQMLYLLENAPQTGKRRKRQRERDIEKERDGKKTKATIEECVSRW